MPEITPDQKFVTNRRNFLQGSTAFLLTAAATDSPAFSPGACKIEDIKNSDTAIGIDPEKIHIWMDGHWKGGMNQLAILTTFPQTEESYVQKVVLATGEKKTLGVRYFRPGQKTSQGLAPYIIFSHVDLRYSQKYFVVIQLKVAESHKVYRYTIDKSLTEPSRMNGPQVPGFLTSLFAKTHGGRVYSSFHFPVRLIRREYCKTLAMEEADRGCYMKHFPVPKIRYIKADGNFSIDVQIEAPDVNQQHYIRYVFITDPVGRFLSIASRSYGDFQNLTLNLTNLSKEAFEKNWGLKPDQLAHLPDCPYLMIFTENIRDGLFGTILWLH